LLGVAGCNLSFLGADFALLFALPLADFPFFSIFELTSSGLVAQKPKIPKAGIKERDV